MINLDKLHVLFIEPDRLAAPSPQPVDDLLSRYFDSLVEAYTGRGMEYPRPHTTRCGQTSRTHDLIFPCGVVTNTLSCYYLEHYRPYVPSTEIRKCCELIKMYIGVALDPADYYPAVEPDYKDLVAEQNKDYDKNGSPGVLSAMKDMKNHVDTQIAKRTMDYTRFAQKPLTRPPLKYRRKDM